MIQTLPSLCGLQSWLSREPAFGSSCRHDSGCPTPPPHWPLTLVRGIPSTEHILNRYVRFNTSPFVSATQLRCSFLDRTIQPALQSLFVKANPCAPVSQSDQLPRKTTKQNCRRNSYDRAVFIERPWFGHLLFDNTDSDARDHAAQERSTNNLTPTLTLHNVHTNQNYLQRSSPGSA